MNRRGFLGGLLATLAAPAVIRSGLLMPVKPALVGFESYTSWFRWAQPSLVYDRKLQDIIGLLTASNEILQDMTFDAMAYGSAVVRVHSTVAGVAWRRINHSELLISG
jgi:hypothetical protein